MSVTVAYSTQSSAPAAVQEIQDRMRACEPTLVVFFASSSYDPEDISRCMHRAFAPAIVIGNTTAGEIVSGRMLTNSVVVMALTAETLPDVHVEIVAHLRDGVDLTGAMQGFERHFQTPLQTLDPAQHVGLILIDGLSGAEERVMDKIGDATNIFVVGGSAGDDLRFSKTHLFAQGRAYSDAAILAVLKPATPFRLIKTQSFCALPRRFVATRVDAARREVLEFDHKPAAQAYADALGCALDDAPRHFMDHPVGLVADHDIFVRSPQQVRGQALVFYCNVLEGMELALLRSTDMLADTRQAIATARQDLGQISGLINFHCILRTLELQAKGLTDAYGQLFAEIPTIGFSTYGEEYLGHLNQTATMLAFR